MRKSFLFLLGFMFFSLVTFAQKKITGKVTDEQGNPLVGVSIVVKGSKAGGITDATGAYSISVPASASVLVFSLLNMELMEKAIGNQNVINGIMKSSDKVLSEVIVVGYGVTRKKRDEAGAISSIQAKQIENLPNLSLDKALQGRAAGVFVQANNGLPGGAINVRIRGAGSINAGNSPLYIVDGLQINSTDVASFTQSNPLAFLNPDDIQSMDIMKDAASSAIYGSNAANGVVIITTKKGRAGKTKFTFNTYFGQAKPLKMLDVTNSQEYFQLRQEATFNSASLGTTPVSQYAAKRTVLGELRVAGASAFSDAQTDSAIAALQTYDWQGAAFRNGNIKNYELSASGGNDKTTFRISANLSDQKTIVTKADFVRKGLKLDVNNKATTRLSFGDRKSTRLNSSHG